VQVLVTGVLLTSGRRTVAAALCAVGLGAERHFTTYHRVLNRAVWSPLRLSRMLLHLLVTAFLAPDAPLVLPIDGTLERRWGPKITLKGRYHDAVRSQPGHVVTTEGIHWVCLALLVPSPWGGREWALPVLMVPTRSPALSQRLGKPYRTIPQYAQVLVRLVRRWYPTRELLLVGDSAFAAARLGLTCREHGVRLVSRLVLNAQLYDPIPPQPKGKPGVKPKKGPRQPKLCDRLSDEATVWQTEDLPWYAGQTLTMDLTSGAALWHRDGEAPLPIRWVLLRDPSGVLDRPDRQALQRAGTRRHAQPPTHDLLSPATGPVARAAGGAAPGTGCGGRQARALDGAGGCRLDGTAAGTARLLPSGLELSGAPQALKLPRFGGSCSLLMNERRGSWDSVPSEDYAAAGMWSIRCLSSVKPARPYMLRFSSLSFVICPSVWP